jgi:hypothetical protein
MRGSAGRGGRGRLPREVADEGGVRVGEGKEIVLCLVGIREHFEAVIACLEERRRRCRARRRFSPEDPAARREAQSGVDDLEIKLGVVDAERRYRDVCDDCVDEFSEPTPGIMTQET